MSELDCPNGDKCLLLQTDFNRDCEICKLCRQGQPEEYAIQVAYDSAPSQVCRFHEIASPNLPPEISHINIYRLAGNNYYSKKAFSYKPGGPDLRKQINEQLVNFFF